MVNHDKSLSLSPESDSSLEEDRTIWGCQIRLRTIWRRAGTGYCQFIFQFSYTVRVFPLLILMIDIKTHFMGWCGLVPYTNKQMPSCIFIDFTRALASHILAGYIYTMQLCVAYLHADCNLKYNTFYWMLSYLEPTKRIVRGLGGGGGRRGGEGGREMEIYWSFLTWTQIVFIVFIKV